MIYLRSLVFSLVMGLLALGATADPLTISYLNPNQTATIGSTGFVTVTFLGSVTNTSNVAVTFELLGGPQPFEPYVAGFTSGVPFPGETLAAGASTGIFALATVSLNPFDPSLAYPGLVSIVLPAVDSTGKTLGPSNATIEVFDAVPEPTALWQWTSVSCSLLAILLFRSRTARGQQLAKKNRARLFKIRL